VERPVNTLKFSGKLQTFRAMKGWTIRETAEKIGVSADHLEYLLTGKHQPLAGDVVRIERRLGVIFEPEDFE
jgi:transcriptional regulator with XRE-family HTH domain